MALLLHGGPCRNLYALLVSFTVLDLTSAASQQACYFPNGTEAISNVDIYPYLPCFPNRPNSMCCRTNSTDTCNKDGLCESSWDGNLWRDFCTDPTWQAPGCTKLCLGSLGTDGDGMDSSHLLKRLRQSSRTNGIHRKQATPAAQYE